MFELFTFVIIAIVVVLLVAFVVVGSTLMALPWYAWVLIVAIICFFLHKRNEAKEKYLEERRKTAFGSRIEIKTNIEPKKQITKEKQTKKTENMIEMKGEKHFKVLK